MGRVRDASDRPPGPGPGAYSIELTRAAGRGLSSLSEADFRRVDAKVRALALDPRPSGSKKLRGAGDLYRLRSGDFRILYRVEDRRLVVVVVVDVGNRRDVYRDL